MRKCELSCKRKEATRKSAFCKFSDHHPRNALPEQSSARDQAIGYHTAKAWNILLPQSESCQAVAISVQPKKAVRYLTTPFVTLPSSLARSRSGTSRRDRGDGPKRDQATHEAPVGEDPASQRIRLSSANE